MSDRTHKIALDPTVEQRKSLAGHAGYRRVAWNWGLDRFKKGLDAHEWINTYKLKRLWNAEKYETFPWSREYSQNAARSVFQELNEALEAWQDPARSKVLFPKFAKRRGKTSFRADNGPGTVRCEGKRIILPRIGPVKMFEELRYEGVISECTVIREGRRWYACVCMKVEDEAPEKRAGGALGVDVGIKTLATCSDGRTYENPKALQRQLRKIRRLSRSAARSRKLNPERTNKQEERYAKLQKLHARARHIREDAQHKATSDIVYGKTADGEKPEVIVAESLNVVGIIQNSRLARAASDAAMGRFLEMLRYKCKWAGVEYLQADQWYPSTKTCSCCGAVQDMPLKVRTYRCACGMVMDRDLNAAKNLQQLAGRSTERINGPGGEMPSRPPVEGSTHAQLGKT